MWGKCFISGTHRAVKGNSYKLLHFKYSFENKQLFTSRPKQSIQCNSHCLRLVSEKLEMEEANENEKTRGN